MTSRTSSRTRAGAALAAVLLGGCAILGPTPMTLDEAARAAGVTESVVRLDDETAAAVQLRGEQLQLLFFIRDGDGWIQSGGAGPGQEIAGARLALIGNGHEASHRTILFGAGPTGVASVSTEGPFVFGMSDLEAETWLLAAPVEHGAAMRWTIWDARDEPLLMGQGLAPLVRAAHLFLPGMTLPDAVRHLAARTLACEPRPAPEPDLSLTHCSGWGAGIGSSSDLEAQLFTADGVGLDRVVGTWTVAEGARDPEAGIGYLAMTVAATVFGEPPPAHVVAWMTRHIDSGGATTIDGVRIRLDADGPQTRITLELADQP